MTNDRNDPDTLEREVERTQDEIGDTVDKLEEKLNPREIARSILGDRGRDVAQEALDIARRNPVPIAMIAVGLIWLLATSDSDTLERLRDRITGNGLRSRSDEPAPIGPPPETGEAYDRRRAQAEAAS